MPPTPTPHLRVIKVKMETGNGTRIVYSNAAIHQGLMGAVTLCYWAASVISQTFSFPCCA